MIMPNQLLRQGFYVMRSIVKSDGTREFETMIFPQGYSRHNEKGGDQLPYKTKGEAIVAKQKILNEASGEGSRLYGRHGEFRRELSICEVIYKIVQE